MKKSKLTLNQPETVELSREESPEEPQPLEQMMTLTDTSEDICDHIGLIYSYHRQINKYFKKLNKSDIINLHYIVIGNQKE